MSDRATSCEQAGRFHRGGDVFASLFPERLCNGSVVLAFHHRQAALKFRYSRDFFPARVFMAKVSNAAGIVDQGVNDVCVAAAVFQVEDATSLCVLKAEFGFVVTQENAYDLIRVCSLRWRVNMDMMNRPIRPAMCSIRDHLRDLAFQVLGGKAARWHHKDTLAVFRSQQMA